MNIKNTVKKVVKDYMDQKCDKKGTIKTKNTLNDNQIKGLKSLKERVTKEDIVIGTTDKTSKFFVTTKDLYEREAKKHIADDKEIGLDEVKKLEDDFNRVSSVWKNVFNLGANKVSQSSRINSAVKVTDTEAPNLTFLLKDHKKVQQGGNYPTRPLCLASRSPNGPLSNLLAGFCDRVSDAYEAETECDSLKIS